MAMMPMRFSGPPPPAGAIAAAAAGAAPSAEVAMSSFGSLLVLLVLLEADCRLAQPVTSRAAAARHSVARAEVVAWAEGVEVVRTGCLQAGLVELSAVRRTSVAGGSIGLGPGHCAAALEEEDVAPPAVVLADAFADADHAEAAAGVQFEAGLILWKYPALQRPNAGGLG